MSSAAQKKAIKDFRQVTGLSEDKAAAFLKKHNFKLDQASDAFFSQQPAAAAGRAGVRNPESLNPIFEVYAGAGDDKDVSAEDNLARLWKDLGVDPDSSVTLLVAWKLKCANLGEISRKEFCDGFAAERCDSVQSIAAAVKRWNDSLRDVKQWKEFYRWVFDYLKEDSERKSIDADSAREAWRLVLQGRWPLLGKWLDYTLNYLADGKGQKLVSVSKDLWGQLGEFSVSVRPDMADYEDDGAWPVIIDDFANHVKSGN